MSWVRKDDPIRAPRALVYNPWLKTLGGGERVTLDLARVLAKRFDVVVAGEEVPSSDRLDALGFDFPCSVVELPDREVPCASAAYDLTVCLVTRQPPPVFSKRSVLYIQFPMVQPLGSIATADLRRALETYEQFWTYSSFCAEWTVRRWGIKPEIVTPAVHIKPRPPLKKKRNMILAVGRFGGRGSVKRQDVLVAAFRELSHAFKLDDWELVIAGVFHPGPEATQMLERVRSMATGLKVRLELNADPGRLEELFDQASLFWHATGFGRKKYQPERAEHFGISTVEAMGHGAVPLVFADGGQVDIVTSEVGRVWRTTRELCARSYELIADPELRSRLSRCGQDAALRYTVDGFNRSVDSQLDRTPGDWRPSDPAVWLGSYRQEMLRSDERRMAHRALRRWSRPVPKSFLTRDRER